MYVASIILTVCNSVVRNAMQEIQLDIGIVRNRGGNNVSQDKTVPYI